MTFARRVDGTHRAITDALRKAGWTVHDTSRLARFVDLVAWHRGRQVLRLIEVKTDKGAYTAAQQQLLDDGWPVVTLRSPEDAVRL